MAQATEDSLAVREEQTVPLPGRAFLCRKHMPQGGKDAEAGWGAVSVGPT